MAPEPQRLHVWLRDRSRIRVVRPGEAPGVGSLLPADDEGGWDAARLGGSALLEQVRGEEVEPFRAGELASLAAAEGLLDDPPLSTPEDALAALLARWVATESSWQVQWDGYLARRLPEGESLGTVSEEARLALLHDPEAPRLDYGPLEELAERVEGAFPDHPVRDRAAVLRIRALTAWGEEVDPAVVAEVLAGVDDPGLWLTGARFVARRPEPSADPTALLDGVRARPEGRSDEAVALWGLTASLRVGDDSRAAQFLGDLRLLRDRTCADPGNARCGQRAYEVRDAAGRLAASGAVAPTTWQEALTAAAWRCHLDGPPHEGVSRAEATWSGGAWTFGAWDSPTATTGCLARLRATDPAPEGPVVVALTLEGDPAP